MTLHPMPYASRCSPAFSNTRPGAYSYTPRRESCAAHGAAGLFERWNVALVTGDADAVAALYGEDAVLLPTFSGGPLKGRAAIAGYFRHFLQKQPQVRIDHRGLQLGCNMAADVGLYTFTVVHPGGGTAEVPARYSFIYQYRNGAWWIVHHHSSVLPEQARHERSAHAGMDELGGARQDDGNRTGALGNEKNIQPANRLWRH